MGLFGHGCRKDREKGRVVIRDMAPGNLSGAMWSALCNQCNRISDKSGDYLSEALTSAILFPFLPKETEIS